MLAAFSLLLIAAGAILAFATNVSPTEVNIAMVGVILMIVGAIGLLSWMAFLASFAPWGTAGSRRRYYQRDVVDVDEPVYRQRVVVDEPEAPVVHRRERVVEHVDDGLGPRY